MRSVINITDLSVAEINDLMNVALDIIAHPENYWDRCKHKKLVGQGIKKLTQICHLIALTGNISIHIVSKAGQNKERKGNQHPGIKCAAA